MGLLFYNYNKLIVAFSITYLYKLNKNNNGKMLNKRGVELSINFLVIIILSIVIFGFGVVFMQKLFSQANNLRDLTLEDLDAKIGSLVCEGSDRVCIGFDRKVIKRKDFDVFGLRILNILDTQDFIITVNPPAGDYLGFKKDKTPIDTSNPDGTSNP